jgi:hypothetical protein
MIFKKPVLKTGFINLYFQFLYIYVTFSSLAGISPLRVEINIINAGG